MGLLKTTKLDNGMVGFECIYGGLEAPFGGIDASSPNPRYIDPKCFADASNFLIINNELCCCFTSGVNQWPSFAPAVPPSDWNPWPLAPTSASPGILLGMGKLECEAITKTWALFSSPNVDSSNFYHYRLLVWQSDGFAATDGSIPANKMSYYDFTIVANTVTFPAQQAQCVLTVGWNGSLTAVPTLPVASTPVPWDPTSPASPTTPPAADGKIYEVDDWSTNVIAPAGYTLNFGLPFYAIYPPTNAGGTAPAHLPGIADVVTGIITNINTYIGLPFKATAGPGTNQITLTAFTQTGLPSVDGAAGNSLQMDDAQPTPMLFGWFPNVANAPFTNGAFTSTYLSGFYKPPNPFTQAAFSISATAFEGGEDAKSYVNGPIQNLTWQTVGSSLYLAGWPAGYILEYNDITKYFGYITQYQGARVLSKFAGHLIAVGVINGLGAGGEGTNFDNTQLWFAWSKEGDFSTWNAVDSGGLVTGAGGEQLADISDMLTGLVISNSVAFILRAEGLSYATVQASASVPFDVSHVALSKFGQGCPSTSLWTQFDQLGFYIGQTNVFMLSQAPQAIGDKIVMALFPQLINMANRLNDVLIGPPYNFPLVGNPSPFEDKYYNKVSVEPLTFMNNNRENVDFGVLIDNLIYMFSPVDGTWMKLDMNPVLPPELISALTWSIKKLVTLPLWSSVGYDGSYQSRRALVYAQRFTSGHYQAPELYDLTPRFYSTTTQSGYIWFPAEEISLGRDITIDALYVLISAAPGIEIDFQIDGWQRDQNGNSAYVQAAFTGSIVTDASAYPGFYEEYQVFNADGSAITLKAPQLKINVNPQSSWAGYTPPIPYPIFSQPFIKISKVAMFGSFDPNQRPV